MWNARSGNALQQLQQLGVIANEEIEYFSDPRNIDELKDRMKKRGEEFNNALSTMLTELYPDADFTNMEHLSNYLTNAAESGDVFAASLLNIIAVMGNAIDFIDGTVETGVTEPTGSSDIYNIADAASGYSDKVLQNRIRNRIADLAMQGVVDTNEI